MSAIRSLCCFFALLLVVSQARAVDIVDVSVDLVGPLADSGIVDVSFHVVGMPAGGTAVAYVSDPRVWSPQTFYRPYSAVLGGDGVRHALAPYYGKTQRHYYYVVVKNASGVVVAFYGTQFTPFVFIPTNL